MTDLNEQNGTAAPSPEAQASETWWEMLSALYRRRRLIVAVTGVVATLSVVIALLLPNWYQASTRLVLPSKSGSGALSAAMLSDLPTAAQSLLGGGVIGTYQRHLTLLHSRTLHEAAVDSFDLARVYETEEAEFPTQAAIDILRENVEFVVDEEYDFLSVRVMDRDPERAAEIANFFVRGLNQLNTKLSTESAGSYRYFIGERYHETEAQLDSVLNRLQDFQSEHGVMDFEQQAPFFFENVAAMRLNMMQAEVAYQRLISEYGENNSAVRSARQALSTARQQYEAALEGEEALLPIAQSDMPKVARQMFDLEKEKRVLLRILEYMRPLYEEARFDEMRDVAAVQVVDPAVPPVEKAWPHRAVICVAMTLSGFLLVVLYVLATSIWTQRKDDVARRFARMDVDTPVTS